jgi:phosphoenolpyruvate carboxylase
MLAVDLKELTLVDPPPFTVSVIKPGQQNRLLNLSLRLVVPAHKGEETRKKITLIQDAINRALYEYIEKHDTFDYRELRRELLRALRRRTSLEIMGMLYHSIYLR